MKFMEQVLKIIAILVVFFVVPRWLWGKKRKAVEEAETGGGEGR